MEWLDLQFFGPHMDNGRQLLYSSHNPYLVFLAYLVACAAALAVLHMVERTANSEKTMAKTVWRWLGASCLAGGIWAMHFISMLAFESQSETHYDLGITSVSLFIAWIGTLIAMQILNSPALSRVRL